MVDIKYLLRKKNVTVKDLATKLGVTTSAVWQILRSHNPSLSTLKKIAQALDVELGELFIPRTTTRPQKVIEVKCPACQSNVKFRVSMSIKAGEVGADGQDGEK